MVSSARGENGELDNRFDDRHYKLTRDVRSVPIHMWSIGQKPQGLDFAGGLLSAQHRSRRTRGSVSGLGQDTDGGVWRMNTKGHFMPIHTSGSAPNRLPRALPQVLQHWTTAKKARPGSWSDKQVSYCEIRDEWANPSALKAVQTHPQASSPASDSFGDRRRVRASGFVQGAYEDNCKTDVDIKPPNTQPPNGRAPD